MAFNPQSGISGSVTIGGTSYSFGKWTLAMKTNLIPVNRMGGGGFQEVVAGVSSAELTLDALTYDAGNMPFATGSSYTFVLAYNLLLSTTVVIVIESIEATVDYDGAQPIKITGKTNGTFTSSIT